MYAKVISSVVLIAFLTVQLAQGKNTTKPLQCFNCVSKNCVAEQLSNCDQKSVNRTFEAAAKYFRNFENVVKLDYHCFKTNYIYNKSIVMPLSGCANFDPCKLKPTNASWKTENCMICKDKNGCNPAGTFSSSTVIMIFTVFGLLIAKLFDM